MQIGNPLTGHDHSEEAVERILGDEAVGEKIDEVFTENEIKERYDAMSEKFPDKDFDEIVEITKSELATDADNMHGLERK